MNDSTERAKRYVVLVALDETSAATSVLDAACSEVARHPDAELHLVHVQPPLPLKLTMDEAVVAKIREEQRRESWKVLEGLVRHAENACPHTRITAHLATGEPARVVLVFASKLLADLVVVGTHDYRGATRFILGSIAELVVRKAQCPVLVVRPVTYESEFVPEIEPPCPDCVTVQRETEGQMLWCSRHNEHRSHARLHYEYPESFALGSQLFRY